WHPHALYRRDLELSKASANVSPIALRRLTGAARRAGGLRPTGEERTAHQGTGQRKRLYPQEALRQRNPAKRGAGPRAWTLLAKHVFTSWRLQLTPAPDEDITAAHGCSQRPTEQHSGSDTPRTVGRAPPCDLLEYLSVSFCSWSCWSDAARPLSAVCRPLPRRRPETLQPPFPLFRLPW